MEADLFLRRVIPCWAHQAQYGPAPGLVPDAKGVITPSEQVAGALLVPALTHPTPRGQPGAGAHWGDVLT